MCDKMNNPKGVKDVDDMKLRDNFIKQQQQLKAMKPTFTSKVLSADSMIEDLLSKKETFQKKKDVTTSHSLSKSCPPWLNSDNQSLVHPLYEQVWSIVKLASTGVGQPHHELADTPMVFTLLMTSGLTTDMLGFIWSLANNTVPGALTKHELYSVLALVALAQSGYIFNNVAVLNQLPQPPVPKLDLSVMLQMKTSFASAPTATTINMKSAMSVQSPVVGNVRDSSSGLFTSHNIVAANNHFMPSQTPTMEVQKSAANSSFMSLDVNNLQSAPVLTVPSNFHLSLTNISSPSTNNLPMSSQNFNVIQSPSSSLEQQSLGALALQCSSNVMAAQNFGVLSQSQCLNVSSNQILSSPGINNAIPSISLGISAPQALATCLNQQTKDGLISHVGQSGGIPFASNKDNLSSGVSPTSLSKFATGNTFSNISSKLSSDLDLSDSNKESILNSKLEISDSDNIDEIFDSLSTQRATSTSMTGNLQILPNAVPNKPNYNIDLFDSFSDVKPIFPDSKTSLSVGLIKNPLGNSEDSSDDTIVTHNPIYLSDDTVEDSNNVSQSKPSVKINLGLPTSSLSSRKENLDDDFTEFQSADFNSFNSVSFNVNNDNNIVIISNGNSLQCDKFDDKNDESGDNFTDFQQATFAIDSDKSISTDEKLSKHDSLFHSLKLDNLTLSSNSLSDQIQNDVKGTSNIVKSILSDNKEDNSISDSLSMPPLSSSFFGGNNFVSDLTKSELPLTGGGNYSTNLNFDNENSGEDKYSALRMLESSSPFASPVSFVDTDLSDKVITGDNDNISDDFGDFITANPNSEPGQLQLPDISAASPVNSIDDTSIQVKCLEACLEVLQKSYNILTSASSPQVLNQVLSDPRGSAHLSCLLEVYKVGERLMQHVDGNSGLVAHVQTIWNTILPYIDGTKHKQMEETVGPICSLCKCNYGPSPVRYGLNTYHAPCANLYLHYVNPVLPTVTN